MTNYVAGKSIIITGAGGGFGRLMTTRLVARGAKVTCADINLAAAAAVVAEASANGGEAQAVMADVTDAAAMRTVAAAAVEAFGRIDVLVNNAGIMPLALFADHADALDRWHLAIDINLKGAINGIAAVYDQMIAQGSGHVINISSIYGNQPTYGAGVYGATKAALNFVSESLRIEARGKIKVTLVKPTGVSGTGLSDTIVNRAGVVGILGQNFAEFQRVREARMSGTLDPELSDPAHVGYVMLSPDYIADAVVYVIDQPDGVSIGDITVRASGDHFVI